MLKPTLSLLLLLVFTNCTHPPKNSKLGETWNPPTQRQYTKQLRKVTRKHREYKGLAQVFEADATFLNTKFRNMQLNLKANFMNWSADNAESERSKLKKSLANETLLFLNFYTPDPKKNKVDKDFADWSVIISKGDTEIEGTVSLHENDGDHVKIFYPTTTVWSRTYMIKFPLSTTELEGNDFKVKIVGPLGMGILDFKKL